ncbi:MAG: stage II sporulation protein M [Candidatus Nitrosopelagicus sp.]|nr:stage II sporulation protein M [Candidatus Nitrosopelagicus sp.]
MLTMKRIILFFIFTAIFTIVYGTSAVTSEPTEEEIQEIMDFFDEIVGTIDGIGIFVHNTTIALPMFIPGFGVAWGLFSAYSTGFAYSAIAAANADVAQLNPLAILLTPFGLMEMAAYSIAMSRSTLLAKNVFQKNWELIKNEKLILSIEIGIVIALLLIGGIVEMWMIDTAQGMER